MAPAPIDPIILITNTKAPSKPKKDLDLPAPARQRLEKAGIDLTSWRCWWRSGASSASATCDQHLSLQQQFNLGKHFGKIEVHPQVPYVPGLPGVHIIWPDLQATQSPASFRRPGGAS
ncbi:hypothetical protein PspLS_12150, partial [Pyricularia sp. CBS 133598]